jgi:hypothetical protein
VVASPVTGRVREGSSDVDALESFEVNRYRVGAASIASREPLPSLVEDPTGPTATLVVEALDLPDAGAGEPLFVVPQRHRPNHAFLRVSRAPGAYRLALAGVGLFVVSADRIAYLLEEGVSRRALEQALVDQIIPRALHLLGKPSLHASAASLEGLGAVALTGESGVGKSTLGAALAARGRIVSDDSLSLEPSGDHLLALPGYPSLRLWPDAASALAPDAMGQLERATPRVPKVRYPAPLVDGPVPLRLVVVLERSDDAHPQLERLGGRAAFAALDPQVHRLAIDDRSALAAEFRLLSTVIERVPIVRLRYRPDLSRLSELTEIILSRLRG